MNETEAQLRTMRVSAHRARLGTISGFGGAVLIMVFGFFGVPSFVFFGIILMIVTGVLFSRANRRVEHVELELAKLHDSQRAAQGS